MNDIPASRRLLNITKGLFDSCEEECTRLRALNAELVAALEAYLDRSPKTAGEYDVRRAKARTAIAKAKGGE